MTIFCGRFSEDPQKGHGRIDRRHIEVLTPLDKTLNFAHVAQVFRVRRERTDLKSGEYSVEYAYGITSLAAESATPKQLLAWNRGHWAIESKNHHRRASNCMTCAFAFDALSDRVACIEGAPTGPWRPTSGTLRAGRCPARFRRLPHSAACRSRGEPAGGGAAAGSERGWFSFRSQTGPPGFARCRSAATGALCV